MSRLENRLEVRSGESGHGLHQVPERTMSKFLVMRVIAKASFVSAKSLSQELGMNSQQLSELVTEMIGRSEVECSTYSSGETMLVMTPRGVAEYMRILESIYELPE